VAGFLPLGEIAELTNAGTLTAFVAVSLGVLVLRKRYPEAHRGFRYPAAWVLAPLAAGGCIYLLASLPEHTLQRFLIWNLLGAAIYMIYKVARGRAEKASVPKQAAPATEALR
jgi:APA family basic amino acid/polyamine antiporter